MADKKSGGGKKIGRWKRSASNAAYKAQDRCERNKRRKATKLADQRLAVERRLQERTAAGKLVRGAARQIARDAARNSWKLNRAQQETEAEYISLATFIRRSGDEKTV